MKIAALVSGGVDSSVVLSLLAQEGRHEITAFYLKIWLEDELHFLGECPWEEDLRYVKAVCQQLNIPLKIVPLQQEYNERVVQYTINELKAGRTPSPDIFCNQQVKFGAFLDHIDSSYDRVATGHYASTVEIDGNVYLQQAVDPIKDQTYFLSHLSQSQLRRCLFPLGVFPKAQVRQLAHELNLPTKDRPDSQGICFLGKIKYNEFVAFHLGEQPGEIREWESGKVLGRHQGLWFHTYGQRKGLRLHGGPWFVVDKDAEHNVLYISHSDLLTTTARREFLVSQMHWFNPTALDFSKEQSFDVKLRHGPTLLKCVIKREPDTDLFHVTLETTDPGLANGQFAVFYRDGICYGAGMIRLIARHQPNTAKFFH